MFGQKLDGELMLEFGEKIKLLRKSHKMSQQNLAEKVGISRRLVGDIEAGRGSSMLIFIKILKAFNKTEKLLMLLNSSSISPKKVFEKENK